MLQNRIMLVEKWFQGWPPPGRWFAWFSAGTGLLAGVGNRGTLL